MKTFRCRSILLGLTTLVLTGTFTPAFAAKKVSIMEKKIEYSDGDTVLEGFLAEPKNVKKGTPVVVIAHDWMGTGKYGETRARMLAELGYIAFAADIYGKSVKVKNADEAAKLSETYKKDRAKMRSRIAAAVATAAKLPNADATRVVVMGYCFGGAVAIEAARAHLPILGAVSFHGALVTPDVKETKDVTAKVLAFHGAEDPYVPAEEVKAFQDEMRSAKADWQFVIYSGAVHSFTNPNVPFTVGSGQGYHESADKRSWIGFLDFLKEVFKQ